MAVIRKQKAIGGFFSANSNRGAAYRLLLDSPMTLDELMQETGWTRKLVKETLSDLAYGPHRKGQYTFHRKNGVVWITLSVDLNAMIEAWGDGGGI